MKLNRLILIIFVSAFVLAGCSIPGAATPQPTVDIASTLDAARTQAVLTVEAEQASRPTATELPPTATLAPSATELPTETPLPSSTPVIATNTPPPTNTPAGPTKTPPPTLTPTASDYGCSITAFSPARGDTFPPKADFDGRWTVKNTGKKSWLTSEIDYRYHSGEKMYVGGDVFDLKKDVAPGESIEIIVDMLSPTNAGSYNTAWSLTTGNSVFCVLPLSITVK